MPISKKQNTRIAILGATSQIAKDLIISFAGDGDKYVHLFARRPEEVKKWLVKMGWAERYPVDAFDQLREYEFDSIINFVGVGDPAQVMEIGNAIFDITLKFDQLALDYLRTNTRCQYLFLSSGAVYGTQFDAPATRESAALVSINSLSSQEWYGAAKLHAECRHRAHAELNIFDIRVFNYFSRTQDISARFLITDILRAIRDKKVLKISPNNVTRDFLHPSDFYKLVLTLLATPAINTSVDCYSRAPIDKDTLLKAMRVKFDLDYEITDVSGLNATGSKAYYYSLNTRAADYGYQPGLTSLAGILIEAEAILSQGSQRAGGG